MIKFEKIMQNKILFSYENQKDLEFFINLSDNFDIFNNQKSKKIFISFDETHPLFLEISSICKKNRIKNNIIKLFALLICAIFVVFIIKKFKISKFVLKKVKNFDSIPFSKLIEIDKITMIIFEKILKNNNEEILNLIERFEN